MKRGLLLVNLGTPSSPARRDVRTWLAEFLADPEVITLPAVARYLLLYGIILPLYTPKSAHAYQAIWTEDGSPLLMHSQELANILQQQLGTEYKVVLGMRYGNPSITSGLKQLIDCKEITLLPLYPQYSTSATRSCINKACIELRKIRPQSHFTRVIHDFHDHPLYIKALVAQIKPHLTPDAMLLVSYHGVPLRHILQDSCKKLCQNVCNPASANHAICYRAQCERTSMTLQKALQLDESRIITSWQSRFGRAKWLTPATSTLLASLPRQGVDHIVIVCPSFVADCLETLEEIKIRGQEIWQQAGGKQFTLIPALNTNPLWIDALTAIICDHKVAK